MRLYCSKSCWANGPDAEGATAAAKARADKKALILFVYERDGWKCRMPECLCPDGRVMDPALRGTNDPWEPTVDHIIQRSAGGSDDAENLRAAHRLCNATGVQPYDHRGTRRS